MVQDDRRLAAKDRPEDEPHRPDEPRGGDEGDLDDLAFDEEDDLEEEDLGDEDEDIRASDATASDKRFTDEVGSEGGSRGDVEVARDRHAPMTGSEAGTTARRDDSDDDFKLHGEVNLPKGSNSGIYLRGRYEVQVEDSANPEPKSTDLGGVYGFLVPDENAGTGAGTWQTFDITLVGRRVTVVLNGKTVICDQTIPGIAGGALDSDEGAPGPIYLQGDHGAVRYRNLRITRAK